MAPRTPARPPKRIFYKIGEVCDLTKTEPYVLRYWESEFPFLAPEKNRAGQRIYSDDDIQMVQAIKRLLYDEGYTTAGARRRLERDLADRSSSAAATEEGKPAAAPAARGRASAQPTTSTSDPVAGAGDAEAAQLLLSALRAVRRDLLDLRRLLGGEPAPAPEAPAARATARRRR